MWDVWFLGQIVYSKIEHPSIINKIIRWTEIVLIKPNPIPANLTLIMRKQPTRLGLLLQIKPVGNKNSQNCCSYNALRIRKCGSSILKGTMLPKKDKNKIFAIDPKETFILVMFKEAQFCVISIGQSLFVISRMMYRCFKCKV